MKIAIKKDHQLHLVSRGVIGWDIDSVFADVSTVSKVVLNSDNVKTTTDNIPDTELNVTWMETPRAKACGNKSW